MSVSQRVLFLSPRLFRASDTCGASTGHRMRRAAFTSTSSRWHPEPATSRYGTANEPPAHLGGGKAIPLSPPQETKESDSKKLPSPQNEETNSVKEAQSQGSRRTKDSATENAGQIPQESQAQASQPADAAQSTQPREPTPPEVNSNPSDPVASDTAAKEDSSWQNILQMQAPMSTASDTAPPHLQTPRHVHHFDTHSLVRDLDSSKAFTEEQAITIMKALRVILADNIHLAHAGIMSRADAEMDAYQFRAASSELRTETKARRNAASDRMRADRSQIQHEVDILGQRMSQESLNLKDELRGMFDDRKMTVRTERRVLDNRISELGYKITVAMNSGMRSEIETLRFLVTRNAAITLLAFVVGSLGALYMASRKKQREERAAKEKKDGEKEEKRLAELGVLTKQEPSDREEMLRQVQRGGDPSLVSLG